MPIVSVRFLVEAAAITLATLVAAGCGDHRAADRMSRNGIEFGIWTPDASGELQFEMTDEVPYQDEQAFGWRLKEGVPDRPVKWVERLELPSAPGSWEGVRESPNVTLSEDGRTATTFGLSLPGDEFIGNVWFVSAGDPTGDCSLTVEFADGRKASFRFRIVAPRDGQPSAAVGEVI